MNLGCYAGELLVFKGVTTTLRAIFRLHSSMDSSELLDLLVFESYQLQTIWDTQELLKIITDLKVYLKEQTFVHKSL